jgi:3-oxoacyl-[acyl-carrier protein] reductase
MDFTGKVAVVTGGGSGIGAAICARLAADGADVAVLDLSATAAQRTVDAIGGGLAVEADVSDSAAVDLAIERVGSELGPPDILVNNAGAVALDHVQRVSRLLDCQREEAANGGIQTPLDAIAGLTDAHWRLVMSVHLDGTFYCTRAAVRSMAPRGSGVIVNMASICGIEGCIGHPHYSAAKAGILGFTKSAAKELIVQGIRVNAVAPGFVDTARLRGALDAGRQANVAKTPAGRLGEPEEIAATVAFLASDDAAFVTGVILDVDGGAVAKL